MALPETGIIFYCVATLTLGGRSKVTDTRRGAVPLEGPMTLIDCWSPYFTLNSTLANLTDF